MDIARRAPGIALRMRVVARVLMLALLTGLVGLGAHLAGGGAIPTTGVALVSVAAVAGPAALLAQALATRHRSAWRAFLALGSGQLGIELVLQVNDRAMESPLTTAAVHLLANVALGVVLIGSDRALAELVAALDRVLPRFGGSRRYPVQHGRPIVIAGRVVVLISCAISPCSLRGPPRPDVLH